MRGLHPVRALKKVRGLLAGQMNTNDKHSILNVHWRSSWSRLTAFFNSHSLLEKVPGFRRMGAWKAHFEQKRKRDGLGTAVKVSIKRVVRYIVSAQTVHIFRFAGEINKDIQPIVPIEIVSLTLGDVPRICELYGAEMGSTKHRTIFTRIRSGADCFGALHEHQLVAVGWGIFTSDIDRSTGFRLDAAPNEVISADGLTAVAFRGMRIRPYMLNHAIAYYRDRGYEMITAVNSSNLSSLKNVRRVGFCLVRTVRLVSLFGRRVL